MPYCDMITLELPGIMVKPLNVKKNKKKNTTKKTKPWRIEQNDELKIINCCFTRSLMQLF
jgi:hypothetical protein